MWAGQPSVKAGLPVSSLLSSLEDAHPLLRGDVPHQRCIAGQRWLWDDVRFEVLHPPSARYGQATSSNARSCIVRVIAANGRAARTGDIEAPQERELVANGADLRSELPMAPHHGSKTSSSEELLAAVQPRLAVIQAGYCNRFGRPALPVLARLQAHRAEAIDTPSGGTLC